MVLIIGQDQETTFLLLGQTGEELRERFSKHRYDAQKRPENNELDSHIYEHGENFDKDIDITILKSDIHNTNEREILEDKFIYILGTKSPTGLNRDLNHYGNELYETYNNLS